MGISKSTNEVMPLMMEMCGENRYNTETEELEMFLDSGCTIEVKVRNVIKTTLRIG